MIFHNSSKRLFIFTAFFTAHRGRRALLFIALAIVLLTTSCTRYAATLRNDGVTGNLIDEENGVYYVYCLGYLRAASTSKAPYARVKDGEKQKLYEIPGLDPQKWLSEDITQGIPFLFREVNEEEPKLADFETSVIHITEAGEVIIPVGHILEESEINAIVNDFLNNRPVPFPEYISEHFTFNFESPKYPGIYYILEYFIDDKGSSYLYDRWTDRDRVVPCSFDLFGGRIKPVLPAPEEEV